MFSIERTSFQTAKILYDSLEELEEQINNLRAKEIRSIKSGTPNSTTTLRCVDVYYEYYI